MIFVMHKKQGQRKAWRIPSPLTYDLEGCWF